MNDDVIVVDQLQKSFGKFVAIKDLSFSVHRGQIVGLLGANGAGKTTLIQMLLGLLTPSAGKISIFGMDPQKQRVEILQRCNFSSAYVSLPYNLKVVENLNVFAGLYSVKDAKTKISNLLDMFGITHLKDRMTGRLSSGESTRLNLVKAMLNDPEILFLDEPTASLDPDIADKVRKLLSAYKREKGTTVIYTSHNMRDVTELCDRVIFIRSGQILTDGTPDQLVEQFNESSLEDVFIKVARDGDITDTQQPEGGKADGN
jgi:ABC-type multidrug transport system, ATPase component